jgi:ribosomal protein S12 methylthiotransferase
VNVVFLVTLGCEKNRVDGEAMGGLLRAAGYELADTAADADIIVVNTCGFIKKAVKESIETILELAEYKRTGRCKALLVTGCMAERYREEILTEIPEADAVLGVAEYGQIAEKIKNIPETDTFNPAEISGNNDSEAFYAKRLLLPVSHIMPVKIAEGCDNRCTYCTIPSIRGPYRSRTTEGILAECAQLAERGAREIVLVAQDTALYGTDLYGKPCLPELLKEIAQIEKLAWVRVMYAYPEHITPEIIEALAALKKVCRYLDMPTQHSHDAVLKRMGRRGGAKKLRETVQALRAQIPDIVLRTTLITGFPGETDEEFDDLYSFIRETRFDRLGVFKYSREDGTPAAKMKGQVKAAVKNERYKKLMILQQGIHLEKQKELIGKTIPVMVDAVIEGNLSAGVENGGAFPKGGAEYGGVFEYEGRSYRDAYDVDSVVLFTSERPLSPGEIVNVKVIASDGYDIKGNVFS